MAKLISEEATVAELISEVATVAELISEEATMAEDGLKRKLNEVCSEETETEGSLGLRCNGVKCMFNGVRYHAGSKEELEIRALARDTMIIEEDYAKIVLVDFGSFWSKEFEGRKHIRTIIEADRDKDIVDGKPRTRLIFLKKDRDYWPNSENDPDVMFRRAMKGMEASEHYGRKPDYSELSVPLRLPREDGWDDGGRRETFRRYFDPRLPGTRFIIENMCPLLKSAFHYCMEDPDLRTIWLDSSLAGIIHI